MKIFCLLTPKISKKILVRRYNLIFHVKKQNFNTVQFRKHYLTLNENSLVSSAETSTMDIDAPIIAPAKEMLLDIYDTAVASVFPGVFIEEQVRLTGNKLFIQNKPYVIDEKVYMVGFGKAVAGMAYSMEKILGPKLIRGILSVPKASKQVYVNDKFEKLQEQAILQFANVQELQRSRVIKILEGAENNQPDDASFKASKKIVKLVKSLTKNETLIVLVSGGGSALFCQPKPPVTVEQKRNLCQSLQNTGASIVELNTVRTFLSSVKGGGLAQLNLLPRVLTLILSDVIGDPIQSIASGPTYIPSPEEDSTEAVVDILKKYNLYVKLDESVKGLLPSDEETENDNGEGEEKKESALETQIKKPLPPQNVNKRLHNIIIGNNKKALNAAKKAADKYCDLQTIILSNTIAGDVKEISFAYAKLIKIICSTLQKKISRQLEFFDECYEQGIEILKIDRKILERIFMLSTSASKNKSLLLISGGEPTVVVEGDGKGGRNQELALRFSMDWLSEIAKNPEVGSRFFVLFFSIGTDGQDGPTDAAGAFALPGFRPKLKVIYQKLMEEKKLLHDTFKEKVDYKIKQIEQMYPENILQRNDSYNFFSKYEKGKHLIKTGLTGTNVMDLHFIYIKRRDCVCDINDFGKQEKLEEDCIFEFIDKPVEPIISEHEPSVASEHEEIIVKEAKSKTVNVDLKICTCK